MAVSGPQPEPTGRQRDSLQAESLRPERPYVEIQRLPLSVDDLISAIYLGISEDRPWKTFIYLLRMHTDSEVASLSLRRGGKGVSPIVILDRRYEISRSDALLMARDYAQLVDQDPIRSTLDTPGKVTCMRDIMGPEDREANAFYQKLMKPVRVDHYIGMSFGEPGGWKCLIRLMNRPDKPDYTAAEKALLQTLHQHLERALALFTELKRSKSELREFYASLDRLLIGVLVLGGAGEVIDTNGVARSICADNPSIHLQDGKIVLSNSKQNSEYRRILADALDAREPGEDDAFVETLRVETSAGEQLDMLIRTVSLIDRYEGVKSPAVVVYISDREDRFNVHEKLLEKLFGLTVTEARLAALLANGRTLNEAASILNVTDNTVRGYSKIIFSKLGIRRQADLVRVILKSVAMFA